MTLKVNAYSTPEELASAFAENLANLLQQGIEQRGRASLVVSGGRTPIALFGHLNQADIDWSKVDIMLADERWVDEDDDASNTKLVRQNLLQNKAAQANYIALKTDHADAQDAVAECERRVAAMAQPFDALILGMGEDGHTASLFPCSQQVAAGLDMESGHQCIAVSPTTAPHQRMSLTLPALLNSRRIFIHLTGASKRTVLEDALENATELEKPITAVVNRAEVELVWAP